MIDELAERRRRKQFNEDLEALGEILFAMRAAYDAIPLIEMSRETALALGFETMTEQELLELVELESKCDPSTGVTPDKRPVCKICGQRATRGWLCGSKACSMLQSAKGDNAD